MADIPFISFPFPATGTTTNRTIPDRLAEVKNVKDYGATGNGSTDDTSAIQTAFNAAITVQGEVFFPPGNYIVSDSGSGSAILWNNNTDFGLRVRGCGNASQITATNCSGYLFDRSLGSPNNTYGPRVFENLRFANVTSLSGGTVLGGGLRAGSSIGIAVRNCSFACAGTGFTTEDSAGNSSQNVTVDNCNFVSATGSLSSVGLVMGGSGYIVNSNWEALGVGRILYGTGISVDGCRCERCDTAIKLGVDSSGTDRGLNGFSLTGEEMEGLVTFVDFIGTVTGFSLGPISMTGHDSSNAGLQGHTANSNYGIRIRANKAYSGEIISAATGSWFDTGGIYIENYVTSNLRGYLVFSNCVPSVGGGGGAPWRIPAASVWPKFIESHAIDSSTGPTTGTRYLYANLPSGGDLLEGDEYDISDGSTATIGNTVTGSSSNAVRVRYNGTNWICIGG